MSEPLIELIKRERDRVEVDGVNPIEVLPPMRLEIVSIRLTDSDRWFRSEYPDPRVTLDYNINGELINIDVVAPRKVVIEYE